MKGLKVKDWFVFGEWFDIFWFHSCYLNGLSFYIKERLGYGLSQLVGEVEGNVQRTYFSRSEWSEIGKRYLDEIIKEPKKLELLLSDTRKAADKLINLSKDLAKVDFEKSSKKEQLEWLKNYHEKHHLVWSLGMVPNVLELENSFLTDYLKDWLRKKKLDEKELVQVFQVLSTPRELSMAQKEEREMLKLAIEGNPEDKLEKHWKKYSWLHFGWTGPSLELKYFADIHKELYKQEKADELLNGLLDSDKKLVEDKNLWIKEFDIPENKIKLFRLLEELLFIKAHRMDALYISYEASQPLLKKIAQDNYLSLKQVYLLYYDWLVEMIKNDKVDVDKINAISKHSVRYFDGDEMYLLLGEEAKKMTDGVKKSLPKQLAVNELKGECAYAGKVKGKVSVVNRANEMDKFKSGDILVSNVTDPSLLPIMKKASAFVTNMGGLTCHAAIVARELKIPCVIGTKIATRVFKDGDTVEVDAERGIVKKIK